MSATMFSARVLFSARGLLAHVGRVARVQRSRGSIESKSVGAGAPNSLIVA